MTADANDTLTDGELLQWLGDDAAKWATEFRQTAIRLGYSDMDEDWLIGWFANAIENAEITRRERKSPVTAAPADAVPMAEPLARIDKVLKDFPCDVSWSATFRRSEWALIASALRNYPERTPQHVWNDRTKDWHPPHNTKPVSSGLHTQEDR
jgi:hypothetical protein